MVALKILFCIHISEFLLILRWIHIGKDEMIYMIILAANNDNKLDE